MEHGSGSREHGVVAHGALELGTQCRAGDGLKVHGGTCSTTGSTSIKPQVAVRIMPLALTVAPLPARNPTPCPIQHKQADPQAPCPPNTPTRPVPCAPPSLLPCAPPHRRCSSLIHAMAASHARSGWLGEVWALTLSLLGQFNISVRCERRRRGGNA